MKILCLYLILLTACNSLESDKQITFWGLLHDNSTPFGEYDELELSEDFVFINGMSVDSEFKLLENPKRYFSKARNAFFVFHRVGKDTLIVKSEFIKRTYIQLNNKDARDEKLFHYRANTYIAINYDAFPDTSELSGLFQYMASYFIPDDYMLEEYREMFGEDLEIIPPIIEE